MKENLIQVKTYAFAIKIIGVYKYLSETKKEFVISKQLLRSGTAPGALIHEAEHAQSKPDFLNKQNIALKEANECKYWLSLLRDTNYLSEDRYLDTVRDCIEIIRILATSVKTTKLSLNR